MFNHKLHENNLGHRPLAATQAHLACGRPVGSQHEALDVTAPVKLRTHAPCRSAANEQALAACHLSAADGTPCKAARTSPAHACVPAGNDHHLHSHSQRCTCIGGNATPASTELALTNTSAASHQRCTSNCNELDWLCSLQAAAGEVSIASGGRCVCLHQSALLSLLLVWCHALSMAIICIHGPAPVSCGRTDKFGRLHISLTWTGRFMQTLQSADRATLVRLPPQGSMPSFSLLAGVPCSMPSTLLP